MPAGTPLELLLRRDRWLVGGALLIATGLCWAWIVPMARDMYGTMTGASAWMMAGVWDFRHLALLFAMWVVMMAGMMLPSAAPALLLYAAVIRKSPDGDRATAHVYAFAGGYLLVWTLFSLIATVLQRVLSDTFIISPMMESRDPIFGGALLIAAGIYHFRAARESSAAGRARRPSVGHCAGGRGDPDSRAGASLARRDRPARRRDESCCAQSTPFRKRAQQDG
jgi:predicted metal-binding membrane protein